MTEATVADRRLHPATLFIRFLKQAPQFVLGLPAFIGFASQAGWGRILLIAALGAALSFAGALLGWLRFRYGVGERDIVIESGILQRQRRTIPFDRVQDIDIEQPLLARLFGTAKVRIETGGSGKNEGELDAVSLAEARRLRDAIRGAAPAAAEGAADLQPDPEERVLFEMPLQRLLVAGLFNFSLFFLAAIGGVLQYIEPLLRRRLGDPRRWIAPTAERAAAAGIYLTLLFAALVLLLGVLTGIVRTVSRDYRFRLSRAPAGFRRRRGLFTLSEVVIPIRRVQAALVSSGWLRKRLGYFALHFQTLSADAQGGGGQGSGHQAAAPFARLDEIMTILSEAGLAGLPEDDAYVRVSRLAVLRRLLVPILPMALIAAAAAFAWPPALLFLPLIALIAAGVLLEWKRHRYAFGANAFCIAEGIFEPRLWILPYDKAQSISVTSTPLQRRLGLASVTVDTAGASILRYPVVRDLEAQDAEALAADLLDRHKAARRPGLAAA